MARWIPRKEHGVQTSKNQNRRVYLIAKRVQTQIDRYQHRLHTGAPKDLEDLIFQIRRNEWSSRPFIRKF